MKLRPNSTAPSNFLWAALAILMLTGGAFAATLYGLAQPGWENDPDPWPADLQ